MRKVYPTVNQKPRKGEIKYEILKENSSFIEEKIAGNAHVQENLANLESAKVEYENEYNYIVRGSILRSRATCLEHGEKIVNTF